MAKPIAVIGLGAMGSRIAARLLACGHPVIVYNRSPRPLDALLAAGVQVAPTLADAVRDAEVVITSLRGAEAELTLTAGPQGFLHAMRPGALHISMSTLPPAAAVELSRAHAARGTRFMACPVQGMPEAIDRGDLSIWASGPGADFENAKSLLEQLGSKVLWVGDSVEKGPATKLVVNMLLFANIELFAEAFHYLGRCGIDPAPVADVLTQTAFAAPLFRMIAGGLQGDHASKGTNLEGSLKDLRMLVEHAQQVGAAAPAAAAVHRQYEQAASLGHGRRAQTAVVMALDAPLA
jgi:3-hydroxyisobutyrate dehydrogenase-like beta-hydroxyacid dehydrogenase